MVTSWRVRLAAAATWLLACKGDELPRTEVLLVVDSDLSVPSQLDRIEVRVQGPDGTTQEAAADLLEPSTLPRSVGLVHERGALGPLRATVQGKLGGAVVVTREAELAFLAGRTLVLPLHLVARCVGVSCTEGQSCGESGCSSRVVEPTTLSDYSGSEPRLAGGEPGPLDASSEPMAQPDSGPADASATPDGAAGEGGARDGGADAGRDAAMCVSAPEQCNQRDDDCDGRIDNGFDLTTDSNHCGTCGRRCSPSQRCRSGNCS